MGMNGWMIQPTKPTPFQPFHPEAGSLRLITGGQQSAGPSTTHPSAAALLQNNLAYTGSTPVCLGSFHEGSLGMDPPDGVVRFN